MSLFHSTKYDNEEIIKFLYRNGKSINDYLVILSEDGKTNTLYSIYQNILFFEMIEDDDLYWHCVNYVKKYGIVYKSKDELKEKRPDILCN